VLASGSAGTVGVDAQVLGIDVDLHVFHFGHDGHGDRGGMDAAAGFGLGHPLHAVDAAFVAQGAVDAATADVHDDFLDAADGGQGLGHRLHLPAVVLADPLVHAQQVLGEEGSLVAAGAGADLQKDVAVVLVLVGNQHDLHPFGQGVQLRLSLFHLLLGHGLQSGSSSLFSISSACCRRETMER
jgi:hypothetical protein